MKDVIIGEKIAEGKTKTISTVVGRYNQVIMDNKEDITAFDKPEFTKRFPDKGKLCNEITCRMFELLQASGIPAAFIRQLSDTSFLAPKLQMLKLEAVTRRYVIGKSSVLQRRPDLKVVENDPRYRFDELPTEFYLKTTNGRLVNHRGEVVVEGLDRDKKEEDPYIANPFNPVWRLHNAHLPLNDASFLREVKMTDVIPNGTPGTMMHMAQMLHESFLVIEMFWNGVNLRPIDIKEEFGYDSYGNLLIGDVIDNDSWRLMDLLFKIFYCKQAFRNGEPLEEVAKKYRFVASLAAKVPEFM